MTFLSLLNPLTAAALGWVVLDRRLNHAQILGALIVLVSVVLGQHTPGPVASTAYAGSVSTTITGVSEPRVPPGPDRRWPRRLYAVGTEPDPRFTFANERTFLAWIRTGLGFLAAGVAIAAVARFGATLGLEVRIASILLILCGLACGIGSFSRWIRNERALRLNQPLPSSPLLLVLTVAVVLTAVVAILVVALS